jgi:hypothetical protein
VALWFPECEGTLGEGLKEGLWWNAVVIEVSATTEIITEFRGLFEKDLAFFGNSNP